MRNRYTPSLLMRDYTVLEIFSNCFCDASRYYGDNLRSLYFDCENISIFHKLFADVAELVDALDLGSSALRRGGSSPSIRTKLNLRRYVYTDR